MRPRRNVTSGTYVAMVVTPFTVTSYWRKYKVVGVGGLGGVSTAARIKFESIVRTMPACWGMIWHASRSTCTMMEPSERV
jgi:hypothetical protein